MKHVRGRSAVVAAVLVLSTGALAPQAMADAPPGVQNPESVSDAWMAEVGPTYLANQDALADFVTWLQRDDTFYDAGYIGAVADVDHKSIKLLWKGSALLSRALTEGRSRGIDVSVEARPYSRADRANFQKLLDAGDSALRALGFVEDGLDGIGAENTPLTLHGYVKTGAMDQLDLDAVAHLASNLTGVPTVIRLQVGPDPTTGAVATENPADRLTSGVTRDTDTPAYNAGGLMYSPSGTQHQVCTSGFAITVNGVNHTTTATHCDRDDFEAYNKSSSKYGSIYKKASIHGGNADILSGSGWYRVFDGKSTQSDGYYKNVVDWKDYSVGMTVCNSGGMSGVHCGLKIDQTDYSVNGDFLAFRAHSTSTTSAMANANGDSGGPVMVPVSGGEDVHATGMGQASVAGSNITCTGTKQSTTCYSTLLYTTVHTILNNWNASLVTY